MPLDRAAADGEAPEGRTVVLDGDLYVVGHGRLAEDAGEAGVVRGPAHAVGRDGAGLAEEGGFEAGLEVVLGDVVEEAGLGLLVDDHAGTSYPKLDITNCDTQFDATFSGGQSSDKYGDHDAGGAPGEELPNAIY